MPTLATSIYVSTQDLVQRVEGLIKRPGRQILGLVGAPGSGKSTVATLIAEAFGPQVQVVEMDAFHLSDELLTRLGLRDRKGAVDTFDAAGYVELLRRIRSHPAETVFAPAFNRTLDAGIVGAIAITADCRLVITTGNYLLHEEQPWSPVRSLLDHAWYLEPDDHVRRTQLAARHQQFGKTEEQALAWAHSSDEPNAGVVRRRRHRADLIATLAIAPSQQPARSGYNR